MLRASIPLAVALVVSFVAPASADGLTATANAPWDRERAAHLLRRAGFGGTPREIDETLALGRDKAVDRLLDYAKTTPNDEPYAKGAAWRPPFGPELRSLGPDVRKDVGGYVRDFEMAHAEALREWWLRRMVVTNRPLEEKMTFFWSGIFTSGFREVKSFSLLRDQNEFLRAHALADFRTLVLGIAKDGAMLRYLDNAQNVKGKPNENFARELLELFTMGVGHYTETDVKEAARALTGWRVEPAGVVMRPRLHDRGTKTFLGRTGDLGVEDVVDAILAQPATAQHLATRLWTFFAYDDPEPPLVDALAAELRRTKYDVRAAMRTLLRSDAFYSPRALHATIKSPVELVVGTLRELEIAPADPAALAAACRRMGQELFQPPNVKGWPGGKSWITTSTLVTRQNFGRELVAGERRAGGRAMMTMRGRPPMPPGLEGERGASIRAALEKLPLPPDLSSAQPTWDPMAIVKSLGDASPRDVVRHFASRLLQSPLAADREATLVAAFSPPDRAFDASAGDAPARVRDLVYLILSMPEYQLN